MRLRVPTKLGDSLPGLASKYLGSASNFREIAKLNKLNVLEALPANLPIQIPDPDEIIGKVQPILGEVSTTINAAVDQAEGFLDKVDGLGVSELQGYTKVARDALGEVNGVLGKAESLLGKKLKGFKLGGDQAGRRYQDGKVLRLVDWLLQ